MLLSLRKSKTKIEENLERVMRKADISAEEDLELERKLAKKLKVKDGQLCISQGIHAGDHLTRTKGFSEAKVDKICESAEKIVNSRFIMGIEAMLRSVICITTGSQALNELLGGSTDTQAITEAFGVSRSGKTQLAHTLFVTTQLPTHVGGANGKVAYLAIEKTFLSMNLKIIYARASTSEHQYDLLLSLAAKMSEEPFRFLIVDSVITLFRVEYNGRGELAGRQQKLAQMLSRLLKIAEEFNVAVYMANQVVDDLGGAVFISDPKKPAGGHVLAHLATIRLIFRKGKGEQHVCKLFKAPSLPKAEAKSILSLHIDRWRPDLSTVLTVYLMVYGDP
ncbi:hypothetical protein ACJRO7_010438 [Eucalyptus globulus]|uniref:Uncharacterized protein n=1 Tax=Eucalyptus globulus TaxID=34317 RepID=A0ABD3LC00_EUCGL